MITKKKTKKTVNGTIKCMMKTQIKGDRLQNFFDDIKN